MISCYYIQVLLIVASLLLYDASRPTFGVNCKEVPMNSYSDRIYALPFRCGLV